jgi:D-lactate dehydrogenase
MVDVIFYETFAEEERSLRKHLGMGLTAEFRQNPIQSYHDQEPLASLISIRTHSNIPLSWFDKIKGVLSRSSGYDHLVDFMESTKGHIPCGYLLDYCSRSVAEHAITVMLSLFKKLKKQMNHFSTFNRNGITCRDCLDRNLLVIGVGKIGSQIVRLGKGLEMNVKGVDLVERVSGLEYVNLSEGVAWADAVICALPLTPATQGLLNRSLLIEAKKGLIFVNISRCEISPLYDLAQLLDEGVILGIGLDVFEKEGKLLPELQGHLISHGDYQRRVLSLKDRDEVIFTPHNAFNTEESLEIKSRLSCEAISQFLQTGRFSDEVRYEASEYTVT